MEYRGFQKIDESNNRMLAIGTLIPSYLAVIMKETQLLTEPCVIIKALFFRGISDVDITRMVLMKSTQNMFSRAETYIPPLENALCY